jgi:DNA replication protein DnaC
MSVLADPNCPICAGVGFIVDRESDGTINGADRCICVKRAIARLAAEARIRATGLPPRFLPATIDGFHSQDNSITVKDKNRNVDVVTSQAHFDDENRKTIRALAAEPLPDGVFVILLGPPGVGKTYLAAALLLESMRKFRKTGFYTTTAAYFAALQPGGATEPEQLALRKKAIESDILLLDDLGIERPTAFVMRELWKVIDERSNHGRATIITANNSIAKTLRADVNLGEVKTLTEDQIMAIETGKRIYSRISEVRRIIEWPSTAIDYRPNMERRKGYAQARGPQLNANRALASDSAIRMDDPDGTERP